MKSAWERFPDQLKRLFVIIAFLLAILITARGILIPKDFGEYGHFRASAVEEVISQGIQYAGHQACNECHDDVVELKSTGYHRDVNCEVCHGPGNEHIDDPDVITPEAPRGRGYCPFCHEYLPARPTGFPQIVSTSHNPLKPCISCHDPHNPVPKETPKNCSGCHAEIANSKSISHHVNIECTHCHISPEEHKIEPRLNLPSKPASRAFCGECHSKDAESEKGIPRVDLQSHGEAYVCWQCHYPHLPEGL